MPGPETIETGYAPIKAWIEGVPVEDAARRQLVNIAALPFIHQPRRGDARRASRHRRDRRLASIATQGAIVPAAVGVDIGCGMMAVRTTLTASELPDNLHSAAHRDRGGRAARRHRPEGRLRRTAAPGNAAGGRCRGVERPAPTASKALEEKHPHDRRRRRRRRTWARSAAATTSSRSASTRSERVWVMLHSGSRGVGNRIGSYFIELAQARTMRRQLDRTLPDRDLAYLRGGHEPLSTTTSQAVGWAQEFARRNRELMMDGGDRRAHARGSCRRSSMRRAGGQLPPQLRRARAPLRRRRVGDAQGRGARAAPATSASSRARWARESYIVRGKGNAQSFQSCSHGAGRDDVARRGQAPLHARRTTSKATAGVECRKDAGVIDETPMAYKDIDAVMAAQADLVEIVHTLRQVVCVKG